MAVINKETCNGCQECLKYCSVDAIIYNPEEKKCVIDQDRCTECYVCIGRTGRMACKAGAIEPVEMVGFYKQFQHFMSYPVDNHGMTGVTGRGTEEVKTNDVRGKITRGFAGFSIDMGRPGLGVYLRDAEKVTMAIAAAGLEFWPPEKSPISSVMADLKTGKLHEECLNYHLLSVIVEGKCREEQVPDVLCALQKVQHELDTVFSVGLVLRTDENGENKILEKFDDIGVPRPYRGKVNVGLGRPLYVD